MSVLDDLRRDPTGAGLAVLLPALFAVIAVAIFVSGERGGVEDDGPAMEEAKRRQPRRSFRREKPDPAWLAKAAASDVLSVPGRHVEFWGRTDAPYSRTATAARQPFQAIVVHFTLDVQPEALVRYQHNGDSRRGGAFGYHVYITRDGRILQGAPLSVRTNHVKGAATRCTIAGKRVLCRRPGASLRYDNRSAIGISMVGGCVTIGKGLGRQCVTEIVSPTQKAAAIAVVDALRRRFQIVCDRIWGHGEVQRDRALFEGRTLARHLRQACRPAATRSLPDVGSR